MFEKLNLYRQNFTSPLQKKAEKQTHQYRFEWVEDLKQLHEVQKFRAAQFSQQFGITFDQDIDQDLYDFGCEHAILRDKYSNEIVAYTRLKLLQGQDLAQSYSAQEFKILDELGHLSNIVEIGRTCVHHRYRSSRALSILWLNLVPKVLWEMRAKYLIGCVSIRLQGNQARAYYTHQYLKQLSPTQTCAIQPQVAYEPTHPEYSFAQDEKIPKLFDVYLKMNAKLSQQAFYDREFNCLDYFVLLEVNKMAKSFVMKKQIQR
ncbi:GNAT family N-acetyltransferase [Acinetobacter sp. ANC 4910]|uniref:GNAT family N-acetyltransferase n=1 Tax=Acinetobacter sp. ANC 4910 TaxID=2529850 RepID=UPI00103F20F5|nr:GNAT family N-acyltransferase [Acinetobacter sp. ANC 4910]TCB37564.1 GNAT family N-acetyltransferase [Acinetobacter sp. ANC 4910]